MNALSKAMGRSATFLKDQLRKTGIEKAKPALPSGPYGWLRKGSKLIKVPKEQRVLCEIAKLNKRKLGTEKIAKILNDRKIPTRFGGKWWPITVSRIRRRLK